MTRRRPAKEGGPGLSFLDALTPSEGVPDDVWQEKAPQNSPKRLLLSVRGPQKISVFLARVRVPEN
jgi:hypothetical protein